MGKKTIMRSLLTGSAVGALAIGLLLALFSAQALLSKSIYEADLMFKVNMSYRGNNLHVTVEDAFLVAFLFGLVSVITAACGLFGLLARHRACLRVFIFCAPFLAACYIMAGVWLLSMMVTMVPAIRSEVVDTCKATSYPALLKEVGCDIPNADAGNMALLQTGASNPNCRVILVVNLPNALVYTTDVSTTEITLVSGNGIHDAQIQFNTSANVTVTMDKELEFVLSAAWQRCTGGNMSASRPILNAFAVGEFRNELQETQEKMWNSVRTHLEHGLYDGSERKFIVHTRTLSPADEAFYAFAAANIDAGKLSNNLRLNEGAYVGTISVGSHALAVSFAMKGNEHESTHSHLSAFTKATHVHDHVFAHAYKNFGFHQFFAAYKEEPSLSTVCDSGTDCIDLMRTAVRRVTDTLCVKKECTSQSCSCPSKIHVPAAVKTFYLVGTEFYALWRVAQQATQWNEDAISLQNLAGIAADVCALTPDGIRDAICGAYIPFFRTGSVCRDSIAVDVNRLCRELAYMAVILEVVFKPIVGTPPFLFVVKPDVQWEMAANMIEFSGIEYAGPTLIDVSTFTAADLERKVYFHDVGPGLCRKQFSQNGVEKVVIIPDAIGESKCRRTCEDFRLCWAYSTNMMDQCRLYMERVTGSSGVERDWNSTKCSVVNTFDLAKSGDLDYYEDLGDGSCLDVNGRILTPVSNVGVGDRTCRMKCKGLHECVGYEVAVTDEGIAHCKLHDIMPIRGNGDVKSGVCVAIHRHRRVVVLPSTKSAQDKADKMEKPTPNPVPTMEKFEFPLTLTTEDTANSISPSAWSLESWRRWFTGSQTNSTPAETKASEPVAKQSETTERPAEEQEEKPSQSTVGTTEKPVEKPAVEQEEKPSQSTVGTTEKPVEKPAVEQEEKPSQSTVETKKPVEKPADTVEKAKLSRRLEADRELESTKVDGASCGALCKRRAAAFDILGPAKCLFLSNICSSLNAVDVGLGQCVTKEHKTPGTTYENSGEITVEMCEATCFHDVECRGYEFFLDKALCRVLSPTEPIESDGVSWSQVVKKAHFEPIAGSDGLEGVHCYRPGSHRVITRFTSLGHVTAYTAIVLGSILFFAFVLGFYHLVEITKRKGRREPLCTRVCCPWRRTYEKVDRGTVLLRRDSDEELVSDFDDDSDDSIAE